MTVYVFVCCMCVRLYDKLSRFNTTPLTLSLPLLIFKITYFFPLSLSIYIYIGNNLFLSN